jgi:hypothetical protein
MWGLGQHTLLGIVVSLCGGLVQHTLLGIVVGLCVCITLKQFKIYSKFVVPITKKVNEGESNTPCPYMP